MLLAQAALHDLTLHDACRRVAGTEVRIRLRKMDDANEDVVDEGPGRMMLDAMDKRHETDAKPGLPTLNEVISRLDPDTDVDFVNGWVKSFKASMDRKVNEYTEKREIEQRLVNDQRRRIAEHLAERNKGKIEKDKIKEPPSEMNDTLDTLIASMKAQDTIIIEAKKRKEHIEEDAAPLLASLRAALVKLRGYRDQTILLERMAQIVIAFVNNPAVSKNMYVNVMITGDAGTGKTRVAKIIAKVFSQLGLFVFDDVVEATASNFLGKYVGETTARTELFLLSSMEKVVFLDEAYALTRWDPNDATRLEPYSSEAINVLVPFLSENVGNIAMICAGYDWEITNRFFPANDGLSRRFPIRFSLAEYSPNLMCKIFVDALAEALNKQGEEWEVADYFSQTAYQLLRDVVKAARTKVWRKKRELKGAEKEKQEVEISMAKFEAEVRGLNAAKAEKYVKEEEVHKWPMLASMFEAQAGAMQNIANTAAVLLGASEEFKRLGKTRTGPSGSLTVESSPSTSRSSTPQGGTPVQVDPADQAARQQQQQKVGRFQVGFEGMYDILLMRMQEEFSTQYPDVAESTIKLAKSARVYTAAEKAELDKLKAVEDAKREARVPAFAAFLKPGAGAAPAPAAPAPQAPPDTPMEVETTMGEKVPDIDKQVVGWTIAEREMRWALEHFGWLATPGTGIWSGQWKWQKTPPFLKGDDYDVISAPRDGLTIPEAIRAKEAERNRLQQEAAARKLAISNAETDRQRTDEEKADKAARKKEAEENKKESGRAGKGEGGQEARESKIFGVLDEVTGRKRMKVEPTTGKQTAEEKAKAVVEEKRKAYEAVVAAARKRGVTTQAQMESDQLVKQAKQDLERAKNVLRKKQIQGESIIMQELVTRMWGPKDYIGLKKGQGATPKNRDAFLEWLDGEIKAGNYKMGPEGTDFSPEEEDLIKAYRARQAGGALDDNPDEDEPMDDAEAAAGQRRSSRFQS